MSLKNQKGIWGTRWFIFSFIVTLAILTSPIVAVQAQGGETAWSNPVKLGDGWFPDVSTDASGRVHVVWASTVAFNDPNAPIDQLNQSNGYDIVLYSYKDINQNWSDQHDIIALPQVSGSEATRPTIYNDNRGSFHLTFRGTSVFYTQTRDDEASDARTWRKPIPISGNQVAYFSQMTADSQETLHMIFTENIRTVDCPICYHVFYRQSMDNGINWTARVDLSKMDTGAAKPQLLIDKFDYLHVVYEAGRGGAYGQLSDPTTAFYVASYDGGSTWTNPYEFLVPNGRAKNITIGQDGLGNLVVAYLALPENRVYYQVSGDQGRTWSEAKAIPGFFGGWNTYPARLDDYSMAADSAGSIHLVLVGKLESDTQKDQLSVLHLTWNGQDWSQPDVIITTQGDMPEWPRAAIGLGNQLEVAWFVRDKLHIFDSDNGQYTVWAAEKQINAPAFQAVSWPTPTAVYVPVPTNTPLPPTATPVDPAISVDPINQQVGSQIYNEYDEMATIGKAVIPALLIILLALVVFRIRK